MLISDLVKVLVELVDTQQHSDLSPVESGRDTGVLREGSRRGERLRSVNSRLPIRHRLFSSENVTLLVVNGLISEIGIDASHRRFEVGL